MLPERESQSVDSASDSEQLQNDADALLQGVHANKDKPNVVEEQERYHQILRQSSNEVKLVIFVSLLAPLMNTTRLYVMELYIQSLSSTATPSSVSTIIFIGFFIGAICSFAVSWFGDRFGHDKALFLAFVMNAVGVFIEAVAVDLRTLVVGFYCTGFAIMQITMAYIAYMLPHTRAVSHMSIFFSLSSTMYLVGPLLAAVIVEFSGYRSVFWFNVCCFAVCLLVILVGILGSQKKLHALQRTLSETFICQQQQDDVFPICNVNRNSTTPKTSWTHFFSDIEKTQLLLLVISMVQNSLCWTIEVIYLFYYALFYLHRLGQSILYTSAMFVLLIIVLAAVTVLLPKMIARIIPNYVWIVSVAAVLFIGMMVLVIIGPSGHPLYYWLLVPVQGACFGCMHIGSEMGILETQPKQHSGKVSGSKEVIKMMLRALGVWVVGLLWESPQYNSGCLISAFCAFVVLILSFIAWYVGRN